jgi:hypothetical protein
MTAYIDPPVYATLPGDTESLAELDNRNKLVRY